MVYFSFQDLMSFGIFIVALLRSFFKNKCKKVTDIEKPPPDFGELGCGFFLTKLRQPPHRGGCVFSISNIPQNS